MSGGPEGLHPETVAALARARQYVADETVGRVHGAPTALADEAEAYAARGAYAMAAAYWRKADSNSAGQSRGEMYARLAYHVESVLDRAIRLEIADRIIAIAIAKASGSAS